MGPPSPASSAPSSSFFLRFFTRFLSTFNPISKKRRTQPGEREGALQLPWSAVVRRRDEKKSARDRDARLLGGGRRERLFHRPRAVLLPVPKRWRDARERRIASWIDRHCRDHRLNSTSLVVSPHAYSTCATALPAPGAARNTIKNSGQG